MMGLKAPDRLAAIAPIAPASDMFEIDIRTDPDRPSYPCRMAIAGGVPGTSDFTATMRSVQSGRFLIENARTLPVFHDHGAQDSLAAKNNSVFAPYQHGWHMTTRGDFEACHDCAAPWAQAPCATPDQQFCFGHTPTLDELAASDPEGYAFAWMMTAVGHEVDPRWLHGANVGDGQGVEDPQSPGRLIGTFDFFSRHVRDPSPEVIGYKTYRDDIRRAYWVFVDITTPWTGTPGAVRVARDTGANRLDTELSRAATVSFDLPLAGLVLTSARDLTVDLRRLIEPVFDPALDASSEPLTPEIVLFDDFTGIAGAIVLQDGDLLSEDLTSIDETSIRIGPIDAGVPTTLVVRLDTDGDRGADADDCAPDDASVFAVPGEITGLRFSSDVTLVWNSDAPGSGEGTVYDLMRGSLTSPPVGAGAETCPASGTPETTHEDPDLPGDGFRYLVRGRNLCGIGSYGTDSSGSPRESSACP